MTDRKPRRGTLARLLCCVNGFTAHGYVQQDCNSLYMALCTTLTDNVVHDMTASHSALAQSAYLDLLRSLRDEMVSEITGSTFREMRNGRVYWYENIRTGTTVRRRYIGEETPNLIAKIERHQTRADDGKERSTHRSRLIRILRAEGYQQPDRMTGSLLYAMARTGVFRLGGTIVGTNAFRLYEGELGIRIGLDTITQTNDLDIAQFERLSLVLNDAVETSLADTFQSLDFAPMPSLKARSVWRWKQTRSDMLVEFLTPSFRPEEDIRDLPALGIAAQSLHFLNYLIADPIKAAVLYRSGVLVQIPSPERFAVHKLIVANRRQGGPDQIKSRKDRLQAAFLIRVLAEDRPGDLIEAYADARGRGPQWRAHLDASLKRMPETAALLADL